MPDMIVRLLGDGKSFQSTMAAGSKSVWQLNQQLDNLTTAMEREQQAEGLSTRQKQVLALADKGAAASKVEYALSLASGLDSQDELNAAIAREQQLKDAADAKESTRLAKLDATMNALARQRIEMEQGAVAAKRFELALAGATKEEEDAVIAMMQSNAARQRQMDGWSAEEAAMKRKKATGESMIAALKQESVSLQHGTTAAKLHAIETSDMTRADKEFAAALVKENALLRENIDAKKTADTVAAENKAWVDKTIVAQHDLNQKRNTSAIYLKLQEMAQRGATDAEIDEYYAAVQLTQATDRVAAAHARKTAALRQSSSGLQQHSNSAVRNTMVMQSLAYGVQDAAQVYGNTGLAGALSASANNMIFATQIAAPHLSIWVALGVAVAQFSAVLLPTIFNLKALAAEADKLAKIWEQDIDWTLKRTAARREFNKALEEAQSRNEADSLVSKTKNEGQDLDAEIATRRAIVSDLAKKMREAQAEEAEFHRQKPLMGIATSTGLTEAPGVAKQRELQKLLLKQQDELRELDKKKSENAAQLPIAEQNAKAADAAQRAEESRKANRKKVEEDQDRDSKYIAEKAKEEAKAHEQFLKDKKTLEEKTGLQMVDEDKSAKLKVMNELAERQQQINTWLSEGRISQDEAMTLGQRSRQAAGQSLKELDDKKLAKDGKDQASLLTAQLAKDKKTFKGQFGDSSNLDLTATEANSSAGFKAIFDATKGGGRPDDPQRQVASNTERMKEYMRIFIENSEKQLDELKKKQTIKTGPA